ncbi:3-methyl-2-oxobutanoate hydroxymethyltransferase [Desulfarculales bacterium]
MERKKVTIPELYQMKKNGQKVSMITAYDYPTAVLADSAGMDTVLVGDSLGNVVMGLDSTVPVTMEEMLHHIKAVRRGVKNALLIGDMPFLSYQISHEQAILNAGRFLKEGGCDIVKLEGGSERAPTVKAIVDAGIPVCAHIGLTPQSVSKLGGYKVQGKDLGGAQKLIDAAKDLQEAGADMIVFECIPSPLAAAITEAVTMITIGIGAGGDCDGQVLVFHDLVGFTTRKTPKMAKQHVDLFALVHKALSDYHQEVESRVFPAPEHGFAMNAKVIKQLKI